MKNVNKKKYAPLTNCINAGSSADQLTGAVSPPIYQTSTFKQKAPGKHYASSYTRVSNPTRSRLIEAYTCLENASYALSVTAGMAAETVILHSIPHQSRLLISNQCYGGTYHIMTSVFQNIHQFDFIDYTDLTKVEIAIQSTKPNYLWIESPTNPLLDVLDIHAICLLAKKYYCQVIIDNTFATPYLQQPLSLGVDVVFHSASKYLNGHSDIIAGAIMTSHTEWYEKMVSVENSIGTTQSAFDSWLILRGIKTLGIRMEKHSENAASIAAWLDGHPKIKKIIYPGLPSHPQHTIAKKQMKLFGGVISFYIDGNQEQASKVLNNLKLFTLAVSMGGVESLADQPFLMTQGFMDEKRKLSLNVTPNLIRLSIGIEDVEDLKQDIEHALSLI